MRHVLTIHLGTMNPDASPNSGSRKRKQPDDEEVAEEKEAPLVEEQIDNEYEALDDFDEVEDEETGEKRKHDYQDALRAQEPETIIQYDGIKITPFNLKDELEEGEFDENGDSFTFNRERPDKELHDTWAESIDWDAVEKNSKKKPSEPQPGPFKIPQDSPTDQPLDKLSCYKSMLRIMRHDETVQKTIRRLGNEIPKRRPNASRSRMDSTPQKDPAAIAELRKKLDLMIELAHQRLEDNDPDIYQKSFEDLEEAIN